MASHSNYQSLSEQLGQRIPNSGASDGDDDSVPLLMDKVPICSLAEIAHREIGYPSDAEKTFEFPGWNGYSDLLFAPMAPVEPVKTMASSTKLNQYMATAIAGNDLTSSVLYTIGVVSGVAGQAAPLCLLLVGIVLYLFRFVYGEACTAFPLNGGAYNVLLNTTSKFVASLAACLTILSYVATAVVSSTESVMYFTNIYDVDVMLFTCILLSFFALLTILGIHESASVALLIFAIHLASLLLLILVGAFFAVQNPHIFVQNLKNPMPLGFAKGLFYGFSTGMLGVTGFESAANYIEEQKPGVFVKTLRNMWIVVFVLNPVLSLVTMGVMDMDTIHAHHHDVLAQVAMISGGKSFGMWIAIDAALVLAGGTLTAFVGVTGLVRRLALDRCLPQFFLHTNSLRGTNHNIVLVFLAMCMGLFLVLGGHVRPLAAVYALSFLSVMALFAIGDMMLKYKRAKLRREVHASWSTCFGALFFVILALLGNIAFNPQHLVAFVWYFLLMATITFLMFERIRLLRILSFFIRMWPATLRNLMAPWTAGAMDEIRTQKVVFFAKSSSLQMLTKVIGYIKNNEDGSWLKVVHFFSDSEDPIIAELAESLRVLDRCYPRLKMDLVLVRGEFNPESVQQVSAHLGVSKNMMFIGCPTDTFPHDIAEFGGVRVITKHLQQ